MPSTASVERSAIRLWCTHVAPPPQIALLQTAHRCHPCTTTDRRPHHLPAKCRRPIFVSCADFVDDGSQPVGPIRHTSANFSRARLKSGPTSTDVGPSSGNSVDACTGSEPGSGQTWPRLGQAWPGTGQHRPGIGRICLGLDQLWPEIGQISPVWLHIDRYWRNFARHRTIWPNPAEVGSIPALFWATGWGRNDHFLGALLEPTSCMEPSAPQGARRTGGTAPMPCGCMLGAARVWVGAGSLAPRAGRLQQWRRPCDALGMHFRRRVQGHHLEWASTWRCSRCEFEGTRLSTQPCRGRALQAWGKLLARRPRAAAYAPHSPRRLPRAPPPARRRTRGHEKQIIERITP